MQAGASGHGTLAGGTSHGRSQQSTPGTPQPSTLAGDRSDGAAADALRHGSKTDFAEQADAARAASDGSSSGAASATQAPDRATPATAAVAAAAAATTAPSATTAAAASTGSTGAMPTRVVELQNAVDAVRATFTIAVRQGQTQARISLSPPSLGAIRISLAQTSDGLVARVVADHPEALRLLMQNSAELRNSLQSSGLHLLRLDISAGGQSSAQSGASSQTSAEAGAGGSAEEGTDDGTDEGAAPAGTPGASPGTGSLIDVMA